MLTFALEPGLTEFLLIFSYLSFEPAMAKSRSMESLYSVGASSCEDSCYDSNVNLANSTTTNTTSSASNGGSNLLGAGRHHRRRLSPSRVKAKYIAEIDEVRVNPIVSKKGFLNFLEEKSIGWTKKYVVSGGLLT